MLPVTSDAPPEIRQAATPKHAVSVRAVTSKSVQENWLTHCTPKSASNFRERARFAESKNAVGLT